MFPTALYRARDVRELDRLAIETGISAIELMERAGYASYQVLCERWPTADRVAVVAGPGNNGGDGFVVARLAAADGRTVTVDLIGEPAQIAGDARIAYHRMREATVDSAPIGAVADNTEVIVDALFGIGLTRAISGRAAAAIRTMNASPAPVLAIDIPSGIHADTGRALGDAVRAIATPSFIGLKQGLFTREGRACAGAIVYCDLGVPASVFARVTASAQRIAFADCAGSLGLRPRDAHKGRFGHVLVVGGDHGFAGAAGLAGKAAGRTGAGLVSIATRREHCTAFVAAHPEMMVHGIESPAALDPLLERASVVAIGPGLGCGTWGASLLERVIATNRPLVIDADAINLLAQGVVAWPDTAMRAVVYTPHPGEAGRVLGILPNVLEADRFSAAQALVQAHPGTWLLKGAGTIIATPETLPRVCEGGNPGMASGGMGDALTGIIAALLAQGCAAFEAASTGACLHAAAGDTAAQDGERGLLASDVVAALHSLADRL